MTSIRPSAIYSGTSPNVTVTIQAGGKTKSIEVDRKLARVIIEAQTRKTVGGQRRLGGEGVTKPEMEAIFNSVRDVGNNNGHLRIISNGERALLQMLDLSRDDRFTTSITDSKGFMTQIKLTGYGTGRGGDGTTSGAEGAFLAQMKALKADIATNNLFGTGIPSVSPSLR